MSVSIDKRTVHRVVHCMHVVSGPEFVRRLSTSSRKSSKRGGVAGRDSTKEKIPRTAMNFLGSPGLLAALKLYGWR